jgi:hypothetical protein
MGASRPIGRILCLGAPDLGGCTGEWTRPMVRINACGADFTEVREGY